MWADTLPETKIFVLKIDGWKITFLLEPSLFSEGQLAGFVSGSPVFFVEKMRGTFSTGSFPLFVDSSEFGILTLPKTNSQFAPENRPYPKRKPRSSLNNHQLSGSYAIKLRGSMMPIGSIFTYVWLTLIHVGKYTSPMDPMGREDSSTSTGNSQSFWNQKKRLQMRGPWCAVATYHGTGWLHPKKLTWKPNMEVWKMFFLFDMVDFQVPCQFSGGVVGHPHNGSLILYSPCNM